METKTGYFEITPGNKSFGRLNIAWYFWTICMPCSLGLVSAFCYMLIKGMIIDIFAAIVIIILFLLLQAGWIAPKTLAKVAEESGNLTNKLVEQTINKENKTS